MSSARDPWVRLRIAPEFIGGPGTFAQRCNWEVRGPDADGFHEVAVRAVVEGRPDRLLTWRRVIGAAGAHLAGWETAFAWIGQDQYMTDAMRAAVLGEVSKLLARQERTSLFAALDLLHLAVADAELPVLLRQHFPALVTQLPNASLWAVSIAGAYHSRRAAVRSLLAATAAPELLARKPPTGFDSGKGLGALEGMSISPLIELGLLASAPGVLGVAWTRLPGMTILLFGQLEAGRNPDGAPAELIDLFKPRLLAAPSRSTVSYQKRPATDHEAFLSWWLEKSNDLLSITLDPSRFRGPDGTYDAAAHYGFQLSFGRLVAVLKGILVGSRRDDFTRTVLLFAALDLFKGLRLGGWEVLASAKRLRKHIEQLKAVLPPEVQHFVIPRSDAAATALGSVHTEFFLTERIANDMLEVTTKGGRRHAVSLDEAAADYVNLVRDAGHTWTDKLSNAADRSLFVAHTGILAPELADIAYVHFLRLLADPSDLTRRLS